MADLNSVTVKVKTDTSTAEKDLRKFIADVQKQTIQIKADVIFDQSKIKSDLEKQLQSITAGIKLELPEFKESGSSDKTVANAEKLLGVLKEIKDAYEEEKKNTQPSLDLFQVDDAGKLTTVFSAFKNIQTIGAKTAGTANNVAASLTTTAAASTAASVGAGLFAAALNAGAIVVATVAIQALGTAISNYIRRDEIAIEKANALTEAYQTQADTINANKSTISSLASEYERLSQGIGASGENISLSADEYQRYHEIVNEICTISPSLIAGYDAQGNALVNKNSLIRESLKLLEEEEKYNLSRLTTDENNVQVGKGKIAEYKQTKDDSTKSKITVLNDVNSIVDRGRTEEFAKAFDLSYDGSSHQIGGVTIDAFETMLMNPDNVPKLMDALIADSDKILEFLPEGTDIDKLKDDLGEYAHSLTLVETASKGFNQQLQANAQDSPDWSNLSESTQSFVSGYINNFQLTGAETDEDLAQMNNVIDNFITSIKDSPTAQLKIDDLIELEANSEDIPVNEYIQKYESCVDEIVNALNLNDDEAAKVKLQMSAELEDTKTLQSDVQAQLDELNFDGHTGFLQGLDKTELQLFYDIASAPGSEYGSFEELRQEFEGQSFKIKATVEMDNNTTDVNELLSENDKILQVLSSTAAGKSISLEDFNSDELKDYRDAIESTNGVMQLNAEKAREIAAAKGEEKIAVMNVAKSGLETTYRQNAAAIDVLNSQLVNNNGLTESEIANIQSRISAYKSQNSEISSNIDQYKLMSNSIREANSEYQGFLSSKNATNGGQMYTDATDAYKQIEEGLKSGKTGTEQYISAVKFLMPGIDPQDIEAVKGQIDELDQYLADPEKEKEAAESFRNRLLSADSVTQDEDGVIKIADGVSMEGLAEELDMAPSMVEAMFGLMKDYAMNVDFGSDLFSDPLEQLYELDKEILEAEDNLNNAKNAYDSYDGKDTDYKSQLASNLEEAQVKFDELNSKKDQLMQPTEMDIKLATDDIDAQIEILKNKLTGDLTKDKLINDEIDSLEIKKKVYLSLETSDTETNSDGTDGLVSKFLKGLGTSTKVIFDNANALTSITDIQSQYVSLLDYMSKNPLSIATSITSTSTPPSTSSGSTSSKGSGGSLWDQLLGFFTGKSDATGTVKVMGNALVGGMNNPTQRKIRRKFKSTLVGELGREIVVDPHTGHWYTVGDQGAEMVVLPRNALVFNHKQTEELLGSEATKSRANPVGGLGGLSFASGSNTQSIDWFDKSIDRLTKRMEVFQAKLANSSAVKTLIKYTEKLIKEQEKLITTYSKSASAYKKNYDKDLSKLSSSDRRKVESGAAGINEFNIDKEKDKERYDNIQSALDSRDKYYDTIKNLAQAKKELQEFAVDLADIRWDKAQEAIEKLNDTLDILDAKLDNAVGYKTQNKILDEKVKVQANIVNQQKTAVKGNQADVNAAKKEVGKYAVGKMQKDRLDKNQKISTAGLTGGALAAVIKYNAQIDELRENQKELTKSTEEYKTLLANTAQQKFDNITDHYQKRKDNISARNKKTENEISIAEAKGQQLGEAYYQEQIRLSKSNLGYLEDEATALKKQFDTAVNSGAIKKYSDEWFAMRQEIYESEQQIQEANLAIIELNNSIRDLQWKNFDNLLSKIDDLRSESNFLIDLMSNKELINEDGTYTNEGLATQGQHAYNYNTYMAESEALKAEIDKLDANSNDQAVIERRNELIQQRFDSIKSAEAEKKAIIDLKQQGIEAEIDAQKELIDVKKKALETEKDLRDYQKAIADKNKNINSLQKEISALEGDDSPENKKKLRELKAKLASAKEDLEDTEYNKSIDMQKEALDKSLEDYSKSMEDYSKDTEKIFIDSLNLINAESLNIASTLKTTAAGVGYSISDNITSAWTSAGNSVTAYSSTFMTSSTGVLSILDSMKKKWEEVAAAAEAAATASVNQMQSETAAGSNTVGTSSNGFTNKGEYLQVVSVLNSANGTGAGTSNLNSFLIGKKYNQLSYANMANLAKIYGYTGVTAENIATNTDMKDILLDRIKATMGWSKGGIVKRVMDSTAHRNGDIGFGTLRPGETVLTEDFTRMLPFAVKGMEGFTDVLNSGIGVHTGGLSTSDLSFIGQSQANAKAVTIDVNAPLIHCDKFDADFVKNLQKNTSYQNAILDLVWSPVTSGKTHTINKNI